MAQDIHIRGLAELNKFLEQLPHKIQNNIARGALRVAANVIKEAARQNSVSPEVAKSLRVSTRISRGMVIAKLSAGTGFGTKGMPPKNLPLWLEYGTKPHIISAKNKPGRMTRRGFKEFSIGTINKMIERGSLQIGANFVGPMVRHPGAKIKRFMRPALDTQAAAALNAAAVYMRARLTKERLNAASVELEGAEQ